MSAKRRSPTSRSRCASGSSPNPDTGPRSDSGSPDQADSSSGTTKCSSSATISTIGSTSLPCSGASANGPDSYNGVGAVVAWTEKHVAPQALVATQYAPATTAPSPPPSGSSDLTDVVPALGAPATTSVVRQVNLFPYPELPAYNGYGNVDEASSYAGKVSQ